MLHKGIVGGSEGIPPGGGNLGEVGDQFYGHPGEYEVGWAVRNEPKTKNQKPKIIDVSVPGFQFLVFSSWFNHAACFA